jgi:superoxide dismutase, Fe-Mn family
MPDIARRAAWGAGAGLLVGAMTRPARAQQIAAATTPKFRVQPLSFNPEKINGLSAKAITAHHDDHYAAAVNRLNALSEQLAKLDFAETPASTISELKREQHSVYNSTILHELYFESLGEAPTRPSGVFAEALARDFGSLDRWRAEFAATGKALAGGSGWVILAYAPRDRRLFNHCCADDGMAPAGGVPLLALDMDKHAYTSDYGVEVGKYVDSFMPTIRWTTPERLYREAIRV